MHRFRILTYFCSANPDNNQILAIMTPETNASIRVSIVDDQQLFLDGLSSLLGASPNWK